MAGAFSWAKAARELVSASVSEQKRTRHCAMRKRPKEKMMNPGQLSLRLLVEKWLAPTPAIPAHVTRFSRMGTNQRRYVRVEALHPTGPLALFFFRHDDGSWCVFPPGTERPTMRV